MARTNFDHNWVSKHLNAGITNGKTLRQLITWDGNPKGLSPANTFEFHACPWFRLAEQNKKQRPQGSSSATSTRRARFNSRTYSNVKSPSKRDIARHAVQNALKAGGNHADLRVGHFVFPWVLHRRIQHQINSKPRHKCLELTVNEISELEKILTGVQWDTTFWVH